MCGASFLRPPPKTGEVHLWCLFPEDIQDPKLLQSYHSLLCPLEKKNVAEATTEALKKDRILARTLVRTTIARYCGGHLDAASLEFTRNKHGKPDVSWPVPPVLSERLSPRFPSLRFNLSHTTSLIACGVTSSGQIGIDVEETERSIRSDIMKLAQRRFSKDEALWLQNISDLEERRRRFVQLWTLKEAYVKAIGKGISASPLQKFSIQLRASSSIRSFLEESTNLLSDEETMEISLKVESLTLGSMEPSWNLMLLKPTKKHFAAICIEKPNYKKDNKNGNKIGLKAWRTVPWVWDSNLPSDALSIGISNPH